MANMNRFIVTFLTVAGSAILFIAAAMNDSGAPMGLVIFIALVAVVYLAAAQYIHTNNKER